MVSVVTLFAFESIGTSTAMPAIATDLSLLEKYTWAFSAFIVASLLAMVVGGMWTDASGPKAPIVTGVLVLATGSLVAGAANGLTLLVIGRALQGLGGGVVLVALYVLIARAFEVDIRPKAFSVLSAAWIVPSLVGPLIAGWLTENVSWRAVFLIVPILVVLPAVLLFPRLSAYSTGTRRVPVRHRLAAGVVTAVGLLAFQAGVLRLDWIGALLAVVGLIAVVLAVRSLLPPGALRLRRGLPASVMMRGFLAAAFFSAEVFVPLALTETRGISITAAGLILATAAAMWSMGSYVQSRMPGQADRSAAVRAGAMVVTVALLSLPLSLLAALPPWIAALSWALGAFGMGLALPSVSVQVMRLSPTDQQGVNSSAIQIVDALMVTLAVSTAGLGHALAVVGGGATGRTYFMLWLGSAALAAAAVVLAGRMRPPATAA
jgi:MFS family permease